MFNETSYPGCGLSDAAAVQRRLDAGRRVKQSKIEKFGITVPEGYSTMPLPKVKNPKGTIMGAPGSGGILIDEPTGMPAADPLASNPGGDTGDSDGGGFDLGGIFSALPWWAWALGAYFLLKKR